ncbi:putative Nucleotidyltransferase superfamily [Helianthus annuus]|nr:putative Nucleotidyltransferase superfamily [Helianthus annuus]
MFVHLTKRMKFLVRVRLFNKRRNTNELPAERFTNWVAECLVRALLLVLQLTMWCGILFSGDVVVHIFLPEQREIYNLEEFYANATPRELLKIHIRVRI